jgi:2-aminoadipate transaminase
VAWIVAASELVRSMVLMRQGEDLCTSTVTQALVAEYCRRGLLETHLDHIIDTYAGKCRAMHDCLLTHLAHNRARWHDPLGGFFFWLRLPNLDAEELFHRAIERGVAFVPGAAFFPRLDEQVGPPQMGTENARLCFTFANTDEIDEGCRRLGQVLEEVEK